MSKIKYKDGDNIQEYVFDLTLNIRRHKKEMITTQLNDFVVNFVV